MTPRPSLELRIDETSQVGSARRTAIQLANAYGCDQETCDKAAIVASEMATNLVKHALHGRLIFNENEAGDRRGLEMISIDSGPGIADLGKCLVDGYSSSSTPGTGLGAIRRLSAEWDIHSRAGAGTIQMARLGCENVSKPVRASGISVAAPGETECGDAWMRACEGATCRVMVADGLGHGPAAAEAAHAALQALLDHLEDPLIEVMRSAHQLLRATRGAAVALAEFDAEEEIVRFAGVGNITAFVVDSGRTQNMVSLNGTLGAQLPTLREFTYPCPVGAVVVFHSDGLTSQARQIELSGLAGRDPAVIAGLLYRDFKRGRDDATVVVAFRS